MRSGPASRRTSLRPTPLDATPPAGDAAPIRSDDPTGVDRTASSRPAQSAYRAARTISFGTPDERACSSNRRISSSACWRRLGTSTGVTVARNWAVSSSSGLAACTSGFNPMPRSARAAAGNWLRARRRHGGAAAARPRRLGERPPAAAGPRPHGSSRPAEGRDRRCPALRQPRSAPDRPELERQSRELAGNVHRHAARVLELLPQLRRSDRARNTRIPRDTGICRGATGTACTGTPGSCSLTRSVIFSTGPILSCAGNRRRSSSDGRSARAARMKTAVLYSARSLTIATWMPNFFGVDRDRNGGLREHLAQRFAERRDHRVERLAQLIVPIRRELRRPLRRRGKGRQLPRRRHADNRNSLSG